MHMDDINLLAKNENELETLIQAVGRYSQKAGKEFDSKKCDMLVMKSRKQHIKNGMELPNQDKI